MKINKIISIKMKYKNMITANNINIKLKILHFLMKIMMSMIILHITNKE